jgi:hypothetical protein
MRLISSSPALATATAVCLTLLGLAGAAQAQPKTAAQYEAEAAALEAQADRLLAATPKPAPPIRPAAKPAAPIATVIATAPGADKLGPPRTGVYGCMNQDAMEIAGLQWGVIDATTYSTYDGGRGAYRYDAATGLLTFSTGPFKGLVRKRTSERSFRVLDERGQMTAFNCPWEPKDPKKLHW